MREVLIADTVLNRISELRIYLVEELKLSWDAALKRTERIGKAAITYEGQTVAELRADFEQAVEFYMAQCVEWGTQPKKPFSGAMNIRIPAEVHEKLAAVAGKLGTSINSVIKTALTELTKHAL